MKKRVLAFILALVMALSLPIMAIAEGDVQAEVSAEQQDVSVPVAPEENGEDGQNESTETTEVTVDAETFMGSATAVAANQFSSLRVQLGFGVYAEEDYLLKNEGETYQTDNIFDPAVYNYDFGAISKEVVDRAFNQVRFATTAAEGATLKIYYKESAEGPEISKDGTALSDSSNTDWVKTYDGENIIKLVLTPPADSGLSATTYTIKLYVGEEPAEPAKVKVYISFSDNGSYNFPYGRTEVTAVEGAAAKYGLSNADPDHTVGGQNHGISEGQVSVLDAVVSAHEALYGSAFTTATMNSYLDAGGGSYISKMFGVSGSISFAVNDRLPMGSKSDGYAVNEYAVSEGDDIVFFIYGGSWWDDYFCYFDKKEVTVKEDEEIKLNLEGYSAMEQLWGTPGTDTPAINSLEKIKDASIVLLEYDEDLGSWDMTDFVYDENEDPVVTDSNGDAKFKFDKAGTYYVSAIGESSTGAYISLPWCEITVTENTNKPKGNDLTGMLIYTGYSKNNDSVILRNETDSYTTTDVFAWNKYEYKFTVNDTVTQLRFHLNLADGAKATLHYTTTTGSEATKDATNSASSAAWINCIQPGKNVVKVVITPPEGSGLAEKTYTINVDCKPTLTALSVANGSTELILDPTFKNTTLEYAADVDAAAETLTVSATAKNTSCTVTYNGQEDNEVDIKDTDKIVVRVEKDGIYSEYTVTLNKKTAYSVKFETYPANAVVRMENASGAALEADDDGVYAGLLPGANYSFVVSCKGYVTKTGTISDPAQLTNGTMAVILQAAPASTLTDYDAEWPTFRNSENNNAVTSTVTPDSAENAELKWAMKYGTGWSASPSIPIIVNEHVYFLMGSKIYCVNKETGDVEAEGTLSGSAGFSTNSPVYAEGMIFAQVGSGKIQAFRADTLESLWVSESIGGGQTISPITYYNGYIYTGMWSGEAKVQDFVCFSITDEDPNSTNETKYATWKVSHLGGYYWVGAYVNDVCAVFGTDDGTSSADSPTADLYSVNPTTGKIIDNISGIIGDVRSCVTYDSGRVYFTTKGGYLYSVGLNSNGTFDHDSLKYIQIGSMSTSTPVVYNGRLYVGCSGKGYDWDGDSGAGIVVVDVSGGKLDIIYKASTPGYPQAGPLVSTAFEKATGKVYVYTTYNNNPGGIYVIEDSAGQTEPSENNGDLFIPEDSQKQYCISTICADGDGTLYYKNDSGYLFAVKSNAVLPDEEEEEDDTNDDTSWPGGSVFGPSNNSTVPTPVPPTVLMPVTGGEESIVPAIVLIACGAAIMLVLWRKRRV